MKKVFILLFMATLGWPNVMLATIPPAQPVKNFKGFVKRSATRADGDKMGVISDLKYEKLPDMKLARLWHQTFPTSNGLVVVGGHTTGFSPTKTAEIYRDGKWQELSIGSAHDGGFSVMLNDGRWMVGGGFSQANGVGQSKDVDIYDPKTNTFQAGPSLSNARALAKAINMSGNIYVSGNWYTDDNTMDFYNGSSFSAVGNMDGRSNPYMMQDKDGNIMAFGTQNTYGNDVELYTYSDGSKGIVADRYNPSTGKTDYAATIFSVECFPLPLPNEFRSSDALFTFAGERYCVFLCMEQTSSYDYIYKLYLYCIDEGKYYQYGDFHIPSTHPETGEEISYRGGVYVNEAKRELYLIGSSLADWHEKRIHIISFNYTTYEWTIASTSGFNYDLTQGSWTLMPDGRLACTGGYTDSNSHPSSESYLFAPPTAGESSGETPDPQKSGKTLVVLTKDGAKTEFLLGDKPKVLFEGKNLRITSTKADVTYALADILRFTYTNTNPTGINELAEMDDPTEVSYQDGTLVLSQLKEGAVVGVYSLDGKLVQQLRAGHRGTYRLNLSSLPKGVYIVKADTITYKIMKR